MCFLWVCVHVAVVCLFSHFPLFVSHVCGFTDSRAHLTRAQAWLRPMQTCGWRLWLRKEGKKEGGEETRGRECIGGEGRVVEREQSGECQRWNVFSPSAWAADLSSWPWIDEWQHHSAHPECTLIHTDILEQLKIAKQRPSTTSVNYLAESSPGPRIRVVPAVGIGWRMVLIEIESEKRDGTVQDILSITVYQQRALQQEKPAHCALGAWIRLPQTHRFLLIT